MNSINKFSTFEAISLIVILMLNNIILNIPSDIIQNTSSGSWINVIFISIIAIGFIIFICKKYKYFPSMDILDISKFLGGNRLKIIVGILFVLMYFLFSSTTLRMFADLLQLLFLHHTPLIFIIGFFIIGAIISNKIGIGSVGKVASISVIIGIISFLLLIFSLSKSYNIYNLFPLMGYNANTTFLKGLSNLYAFSGLSLLFFMKPTLTDEKSFTKIAIISVSLSAFLLIACIINQILLFGAIYESEVLAGMVLSSRILNFGNFFERVDAIFTFIWIFTEISALSISSCLILYIFRKIINLSDQNGMLYGIIMLIFGICILPKNYLEMSTTILPFSYALEIAIIFVITPIILTLANFKFKRHGP